MARRVLLRTALVLALLLPGAVLAATALGAHPAKSQAAPRAQAGGSCFGAAAFRDGARCRGALTQRSVTPAPQVARTRPNEPCATTSFDGALKLCTFGAPAAGAKATVALVGDSHAQNWRAAVASVARAKDWHGVSIALGGCPYSTITRVIPDWLRKHCAARNADVPGWFARHPEVHTVFVAQISGVKWVVPPGANQFQAQVAGYVKAWSALPPSVQHIIVIRDTPKALPDTRSCVDSAVAAHRPAGELCRMPRSAVIDADAAVAAAQRLGPPRVQVVNLDSHFCDSRWCYPVIGGALVQKDLNHLSAPFMKTLGPYLLKDVNALLGARTAR